MGVLDRSPEAVRAAMLIRIAFDVADAVVLAPVAQNPRSRNKILVATLGWAALNTAAVLADRRRG